MSTDLDSFLDRVAQRRHELPDHPLHRAVREHDIDGLRRLLDAGEDVDVRLSRHVDHGPFCGDLTPLMEACADESDSPDILDLLLQRGADISAHSEMGVTALYYAASSAKLERVALLLEHGANAKDESAHGMTALMAACGTHLYPWGSRPSAEIAQALIDRGADVHARGPTGETALHAAAASGHVGCVRALLASGAKADARDEADHTPLFSATGQAVARALIEASTDGRTSPSDDWPLAQSLAGNTGDAIQALLDLGLAEADTERLTSLALHAAREGNAESLRALLMAGADASARDVDDCSLLQRLAENAIDLAPVAALLEFDFEHTGGSSEPPLGIAVQHRNVEMVRELLRRGAGDARRLDRRAALAFAREELAEARRPSTDDPGMDFGLDIRQVLLDAYMGGLHPSERQRLDTALAEQQKRAHADPHALATELASHYGSGILQWERRILVDIIEARVRGYDPKCVMVLPTLSEVAALEQIVALLSGPVA